MRVRMQRRIRLFKGVYINIGKGGATSLTGRAGPLSVNTNLKTGRTQATGSVRGTGLSVQEELLPGRKRGSRDRSGHAIAVDPYDGLAGVMLAGVGGAMLWQHSWVMGGVSVAAGLFFLGRMFFPRGSRSTTPSNNGHPRKGKSDDGT